MTLTNKEIKFIKQQHLSLYNDVVKPIVNKTLKQELIELYLTLIDKMDEKTKQTWNDILQKVDKIEQNEDAMFEFIEQTGQKITLLDGQQEVLAYDISGILNIIKNQNNKEQ